MSPIALTLASKAQQRGFEDAQRGLPPDPDTFVGAYLQEAEIFSPAENPIHQQVNAGLATTQEVEQLQVEIEELEVQLAEHTSPTWLLIGILFLFPIDVEANVVFFRNDGFTGVPLLVLSVGLAVVLFVLTFQLAKHAQEA